MAISTAATKGSKPGVPIGLGITNPRLLRKKLSKIETLCRGLGSAPSTARYQNSIWNSNGKLRTSST